jgi:hypothetical protein
MTEPNAQRAAEFEELMRLERSQNPDMWSGLAMTAFGAALVFAVIEFFFVTVFSLVLAVTALVFAAFAVPQILHGDRRGMPLVIGTVLLLAGGLAVMLSVLNTD